MTKVIGLTGGIGSGKSTVAQYLGELGAVLIDADKVGHEAFKPGTPAWKDVVATFGRGIVTPGGEIDRKELGKIVFSDPQSLSRLNGIMHPRIYDMAKARIEEYRRQGVEVVVLEAAILIEAGWDTLVDQVWVAVADEQAVMARLKKQRQLNEAQTQARIRSQLSNEERVKHADVVINNDAGPDELKAKVKELWEKLHR